MRILYGVAGEGLGHASRAKAVLEVLKGDVTVLSCSRAYSYLKKEFNTHRIYGFHIIYGNNSVREVATFLYNFIRLPLLMFSFVKTLFYAITLRPQIIVTDYDPFTCYAGLLLGIPVISINNQHILNRSSIRYLPGQDWQTFKTKWVNAAFIPSAKEFLITTFSFGHHTVMNAHLIPPIVRKAIQQVKVKDGEYILVYQTSKSNTHTLNLLKQLPYKFVVYGAGSHKDSKNVTFRTFREDMSFFKDLAECRAVITNGGFSLISEAVLLGKPVLAEPVHKQYEQFLNGLMLQWEGFGVSVPQITRENLEAFLKDIPRHKKRLRVMSKLDRASGVKEVVTSIKKFARVS